MPKKLAIAKLPEPILSLRAEAVDEFSGEELKTLIEDMIFTVLQVKGVGLAAPQVGLSKRIIIVASKPNARYPYAPEMAPIAMINPKIISASKQQEADWEGCLSVPDSRGKVPRSKEITIEYSDVNGKQIQENYTGFLARIIQHEIDHLDGVTFVERMDKKESLVNEAEFQSLISTHG